MTDDLGLEGNSLSWAFLFQFFLLAALKYCISASLLLFDSLQGNA